MSSITSLNRVTLIGNLGRDPEVRHSENGAIRASFTLATNDYFKNKAGEKVSKTEWHTIVLWGKMAEICEKYLVKGKQVYIDGKLSNRSFEGKDGEMRHITEVVANSIVLLGNGKNEPNDLPNSSYYNDIDFEK